MNVSCGFVQLPTEENTSPVISLHPKVLEYTPNCNYSAKAYEERNNFNTTKLLQLIYVTSVDSVLHALRILFILFLFLSLFGKHVKLKKR